MKRGFFIVLFLAIIFHLSLANAINICSSQDQVILKLSTDTNAHAEVWNGPGHATTQICYDQIFEQLGNGDHTCSGTNTVLKLSSTDNAHAEGPQGMFYNVDVCYGNLICRLVTSGVCNSNEKAVVKLSSLSLTNAHLEIASSTNYNNIICCSISTAPPPPAQTKAYWADTSGVEYAAGATIMVGATLQLVAEGVPDNAQVTFTVFAKDSFGVDDQITQIQVNAVGTVARRNWTPSPSDYELYFTATSISNYDEISNEIFLINQVVIGEPEKKGCSQFTDTDQNTCNNAQESVWKEDEASIVALTRNPVDGAGGAGCGGTRSDGSRVDCSCNYDTTNSQCNFLFTIVRTSPPPPGTISCTGGCNINSQNGECTDNTATINYSTSFGPILPGADCAADKLQCDELDGESEEVSCGLSPSLILPFFDFSNTILTIFIITIIYIFLSVNLSRYIFKDNSTL